MIHLPSVWYLQDLRRKADSAQRQGQVDKVADLRYYAIPDIERQIQTITAEQAKAFGLVDEIFTHEPVPKTGLPQQAAKANEQPDPAPQPTERERLFRSFLNAFFHDGNLNVSNRETFLRDVFSSIAIRTNQINNI